MQHEKQLLLTKKNEKKKGKWNKLIITNKIL